MIPGVGDDEFSHGVHGESRWTAENSGSSDDDVADPKSHVEDEDCVEVEVRHVDEVTCESIKSKTKISYITHLRQIPTKKPANYGQRQTNTRRVLQKIKQHKKQLDLPSRLKAIPRG